MGMRLRNTRKDKRGIDTIIASLLMVVIVVIASVMVYAYATGLLGALLIAPQIAKESVTLEYSSFAPDNKNVTLYLRNTGGTPVTLTSYYVKDGTGNQYSKSVWNTTSFTPTTLVTVRILISTDCTTGCTATGTAFTFATGNAYTVTLVTSRNGAFSYSVVR